MFHPNIYTQKTTAFQKNCGFSVPLILQGFRAFFIHKINFAKIAIYRKISYIFECYVPPDVPPAMCHYPLYYKGV